ncbi:hypothetical protein Dsin_008696 [Dipteronia sinensis]|uniref:Protein ENHANCED DISEASE RESISTANCE 2 C-terminal domain-containing protein n=1 Tax=Dipteronia sinensis TaxID=43782 RepID=A0AAE0AP65_9ROSI|nr:hypothetical protein Dsin_008696 [Dipteronia sinensis]
MIKKLIGNGGSHQRRSAFTDDDPAAAIVWRKAQSLGSSLKSFVFAMNLHVLGKDHHNVVFYFTMEDLIPSISLLYRFINGDDAFQNQRRPGHNENRTSLMSGGLREVELRKG